MREECLECGLKHVAKAIAQMGESRLGYPAHVALANGELAEACDELVVAEPKIAKRIRDERILLMADPKGYNPKLIPILEKLYKLYLNEVYKDK